MQVKIKLFLYKLLVLPAKVSKLLRDSWRFDRRIGFSDLLNPNIPYMYLTRNNDNKNYSVTYYCNSDGEDVVGNTAIRFKDKKGNVKLKKLNYKSTRFVGYWLSLKICYTILFYELFFKINPKAVENYKTNKTFNRICMLKTYTYPDLAKKLNLI